jgi:hypothetical protein
VREATCVKVTCAACGNLFDAKRSTAKYCGATCRKRESRKPDVAVVSTLPVPAPGPELPLVAAVRAELEAVGRLETPAGQQALRLAERMCSPYDTGQAMAAVSKELRAVMAEATKDAPKAADRLDELAERRQLRAAGA